MKHEKLSEALDEIRDDYIRDAISKKKKRLWPGAVAAVLAVAVAAGIFLPRIAKPNDDTLQNPTNSQTEPMNTILSPESTTTDTRPVYLDALLAAPEYPRLSAYPTDPNDTDGYTAWRADQRALHDQPDDYADNLQSYFADLIPELLTDSDSQNPVCSPVNIYMALAMLAETTDGQSRRQILTLLKADSIDTLRTQAGQVWQAHYNNDGLSSSVLGSSLWLHEDVAFNEATVNTLADNYYASVFRGKLGSDEINAALQSWLNAQTSGLLEEQSENIKLDPNSVMAIATTILYQVQWLDEFREANNTEATFHGANGDTETVFMNRELAYGPYYWSDNFSAVYLPLEDESRMWLLLPDDGVAPEDILEEAGTFFAQGPYTYDSSYKNQKRIIVNLSIPKFDIASDMDLVEKLQKLGVTDIFHPSTADFSALLTQADDGYVNQVKHAARVAIDEQGVTAAAFTVIDRCGSGMPPQEQVDFTLDRPFLFYIESSDGLPLFTGIVNEP